MADTTRMIFGTYTLTCNPSDITMIKPDKMSAYKKTYSGVDYFNWGSTIIGKEVELAWEYMTVAEFATLDALYADDDDIEFDPQDDTGQTYNIKIIKFDGTYDLQLEADSWARRKDIKMTILILSEV